MGYGEYRVVQDFFQPRAVLSSSYSFGGSTWEEVSMGVVGSLFGSLGTSWRKKTAKLRIVKPIPGSAFWHDRAGISRRLDPKP